MNIEILDIKLTPCTSVRASLDPVAVKEYAKSIAKGDQFPPVLVYRVDGELWLVDGYTRCEAVRRNNRTAIDAEIVEGTREEAVKAALGANQKHGRRLNAKDRRRAAGIALVELHDQSDREIAALIGCSDKTVAAVRREMEVTSEIPQSASRVGADGKSHPAKRTRKKTEDIPPAAGVVLDGQAQPEIASSDNEINATAASAATTVPQERASKAVGTAIAQQAIALLRNIPENDPERVLGLNFVHAWLNEEIRYSRARKFDGAPGVPALQLKAQ